MDDQVTYWNYLDLEQLLSLQKGIPNATEPITEDELNFIVVHQVFELWFKLIIQEIKMVRNELLAPRVEENTIPVIVHHLKRVNTVMQLSGDHFKLMETLTPQDFMEFRAKLGTASGFQSFQLREIELLLGLELAERERHGHGDPIRYITEIAKGTEFGKQILIKLEDAKSNPSLRDALHEWLYRTPIHGSSPQDPEDQEVIASFISNHISVLRELNESQIQQLIADGADEQVIRSRFEPVIKNAVEFLKAADIKTENQHRNSRIRTAVLFIESYRDLPLLAWPRLLLDTIVEMEELFINFRFQHARMVERIIGRRVGTGGSSGVDYLDETTQYRMFPELWAVRALLVPKEKLPGVKQEDLYFFASDVK